MPRQFVIDFVPGCFAPNEDVATRPHKRIVIQRTECNDHDFGRIGSFDEQLRPAL